MIPRRTIEALSFMAVVVIVTAAFIWLLLPYYGAVLWAVILAILFTPLHRRLLERLGGRHNLAAALSVTVCICIVVVPVTLILASLAQEAAGFYRRISSQELDLAAMLARIRREMPPFVLDTLTMLNLGNLAEIQARLTSFLLQATQTIAGGAVTFGQNTAELFVSLGIMLYLLFFLFRDGTDLTAILHRASPLDKRHTGHILSKFASVVKATIQGNVIIAAMQGGIGGIAFWALGLDGAILWGVLMAVLSLLPAVGAALVWLPAAGYLLLSGDYMRGVILLAIGTLVISTVDNFVRPLLVGRGTRLPDYVVLVSTVGGLSLIGMNGFVIGPLIAALFLAVWSLFIDDQSHS